VAELAAAGLIGDGVVVCFAGTGWVGRYSAPCWPQAQRLAPLAARTSALT